MQALLVGLGRMGQRHRRALRAACGSALRIVTVDPRAIENDAERGPYDIHVSSLRDVSQEEKFDVAVDARPNFDRLGVLREFLARKIPALIVEKPSAQSLSEMYQMIEAVRNTAVPPRVMVPFYLRFAEMYSPATLEQLRAGALRSISVSGGSVGLGCNGVHMLDLGAYHIGTEPQTVFADLSLDILPSPRGDQYRDHAGTVFVKYPNATFLLHIIPHCAAGATTNFLFEHGKIVVTEQNASSWRWFRQSEETWNLPPYRVYLDSEIDPPMPFCQEEGAMMRLGLESLLNGRPVPSLEDGLRTLKIIALAIVSQRERRVVEWSDEAAANRETFQFT